MSASKSFSHPVPAAPLVDIRTGRITLPWLQFILNIDGAVESGGIVPIPVITDVSFLTPNTSGRIANLEAKVKVLEMLLAEAIGRGPANLSNLEKQVSTLTALTMGTH